MQGAMHTAPRNKLPSLTWPGTRRIAGPVITVLGEKIGGEERKVKYTTYFVGAFGKREDQMADVTRLTEFDARHDSNMYLRF